MGKLTIILQIQGNYATNLAIRKWNVVHYFTNIEKISFKNRRDDIY